MSNDTTQVRSRANIRLAILLGLVAFGFFLLGMYYSVAGRI